MDNNTLINIKQNWLDNIKSYMSQFGFNETEFGYERIETIREPGQTISINGRIMQQQGKEIELKKSVTFLWDGWVANVDESNKVDFSQIKFEVYQGKRLIMSHEDMFYWDEPDFFIKIFKKAFNI